MEYKFEKNKMDLHVLREFCERDGEAVEFRKGDQLEREGDPAGFFILLSRQLTYCYWPGRHPGG